LTRRLIRSQEQERQAVAGELHDRMSGHLFALRQASMRCPGYCNGRTRGRGERVLERRAR
jgi:glucose-6-phosphate-specific signal transduction histidine kinase